MFGLTLSKAAASLVLSVRTDRRADHDTAFAVTSRQILHEFSSKVYALREISTARWEARPRSATPPLKELTMQNIKIRAGLIAASLASLAAFAGHFRVG